MKLVSKHLLPCSRWSDDEDLESFIVLTGDDLPEELGGPLGVVSFSTSPNVRPVGVPPAVPPAPPSPDPPTTARAMVSAPTASSSVSLNEPYDLGLNMCTAWFSLSPTAPPGDKTDSVSETDEVGARDDSAEQTRHIFSDLGIEHMIGKVQWEFQFQDLGLLKFVAREEFERFVMLRFAGKTEEQSALRQAYRKIAGAEATSEGETVRETNLSVRLRENGLDDFWVAKLQEDFGLKSIEELSSVEKIKIENYVQSLENPVQATIRRILLEVCSDGPPLPNDALLAPNLQFSENHDFPAGPDVLSALSNGIFFSHEMHEVLREREPVLEISCSDITVTTPPVSKIFTQTLTSKEATEIFLRNLHKHVVGESGQTAVNVWGVQIVSTSSTNTFVASVHFQRIPVAAVTLTAEVTSLRPEVIAALQEIEETNCNPRRLVGNFFERFGTHFSQGPVELGGMLVGVASWEGFPEADRAHVTESVLYASELALLQGFSDDLQPAEPFNGNNVLGINTTRSASSMDFRKIDVKLVRIGGNPDARDRDTWTKSVKENKSLRRIVRLPTPTPIWTLLEKHAEQLENHAALSAAMEQEWRRLNQPAEDENTEPKHEETEETEPKEKMETKPQELSEAEPKEQQETEPKEVLETESKELLETESKELLETEPKEVLETQPKELLETESKEPAEIEPKEQKETEPKELLETETKELLETETKELLETEPKELLETEPKEVLESLELPSDYATPLDLPSHPMYRSMDSSVGSDSGEEGSFIILKEETEEAERAIDQEDDAETKTEEEEEQEGTQRPEEEDTHQDEEGERTNRAKELKRDENVEEEEESGKIDPVEKQRNKEEEMLKDVEEGQMKEERRPETKEQMQREQEKSHAVLKELREKMMTKREERTEEDETTSKVEKEEQIGEEAERADSDVNGEEVEDTMSDGENQEKMMAEGDKGETGEPIEGNGSILKEEKEDLIDDDQAENTESDLNENRREVEVAAENAHEIKEETDQEKEDEKMQRHAETGLTEGQITKEEEERPSNPQTEEDKQDKDTEKEEEMVEEERQRSADSGEAKLEELEKRKREEIEKNMELQVLEMQKREEKRRRDEQEANLLRKEIMRNRFRKEVLAWVERHARSDKPDDVTGGLGSLALLRVNHPQLPLEDWQRGVVYVREVQNVLVWSADNIRKFGLEHQVKVVESLREILHPVQSVSASFFPGVDRVIRVMEQTGREEDVDPPLAIIRLRQLPEVLKARLARIGEETRAQGADCEMAPQSTSEGLKTLQKEIEALMKDLSAKKIQNPAVYLALGVLQAFGFSCETLQFQHLLTWTEFERLSEVFDRVVKNFDDLQDNDQRHNYILCIAMQGLQPNRSLLKQILENIGGDLCDKLRRSCVKPSETSSGAEEIDFEKLEKELLNQQMRNGNELGCLAQAVQNQLGFLSSDRRASLPHSNHPPEVPPHQLDGYLAQLLKALELTQFYPQKLTYSDVIKLTDDVDVNRKSVDVNRKPAAVGELASFFVRRIIALDSDARENCHVRADEASDSDSDSDSDSTCGDEDLFAIRSVHPLDLVYAVFLCADDFLRQELVDKMARCQYAVPFLLPEPRASVNPEFRVSTLLHWAFKSLNRNFCCDGSVENKTLVDAEMPLVVCVSVGEETSWKSRLMNKMLSPQQETFWHQGLKGGNRHQVASRGMVEVAWYLPGRHGDNKFPSPVAVANLRQDVDLMEPDPAREALCGAATVTCFFVEEVTPEVMATLRQGDTAKKAVLLVLYRNKKAKVDSQQLQDELKMQKHQIICRAAEDSNFDSVFERLKKSLETMMTGAPHVSLSAVATQTEDCRNIRVDAEKRHIPQMAVNSILRDIDQLNSVEFGSAKDLILLCQSDLKSREEIAALDKELCRQRKLRDDKTVQSYGYEIREKKWKLQLQQLLKPMSDTFKYFLQCLMTFTAEDRRYFLQCLKLGLDERSVEILQPLYEEYDACRVKEDSPDRDKELQEIDRKLAHGSLGIEHFFRELALLYENTANLKERESTKELDGFLANLAKGMADVLLDGTAIEIMDGDAVNVPLAWLKAVLTNIENSTKKSLFKLSVLGAQSCGKSTLLNTVFGLNFPVSSGRCTRGAYMQLVPLHESLAQRLHCDYLAVIDSEGLMSRHRGGSSDFDNELSTFIIGLSDLTLVMIKGEGNEMHDVLPLAIHVFMSMNLLGERQSCHFVHQNMGAVDAMTKNATEIDAFVRDLNTNTLAAAKNVGLSDQYKKFTDVLHYDPREDNTYVPGLWDGSLPMAKTNSHYSKTAQRLKYDIIKSIDSMEGRSMKRTSNFSDFSSRLDELWNAIKYENFILSFKNVLAVEAHVKLSKIFDDRQWNAKMEIRHMLQEEENIIKNEARSGRNQQSLPQRVQRAQARLAENIAHRIEAIKAEIMHYFQCPGCDNCKAEVANRHLLANNEREFRDDVKYLQTTLKREIEDAMEKLEITLRTEERIDELSSDMDDILKRKVQETVKTRKSERLSEAETEQVFEELWEEAAGDILRTAKRAERTIDVEAAVQSVIRSFLDQHFYQYLRKEAAGTTHTKRHVNKSRYKQLPPVTHPRVFVVNRDQHIKLLGKIDRFVDRNIWSLVTEKDAERLQQASDDIIKKTKSHYQCHAVFPKGKQFRRKDAELLFKDVVEEIKAIRDERFKVTDAYKVDLVRHIETQCVPGFQKLDDRYYHSSSPEALLDEKKKFYREVFVTKMQDRNEAVALCQNVLKDLILENVDEQLSCTELLHSLRAHCGNTFRDVRSIQASIMHDLLRENNFDLFRRYIKNYKDFVKSKMAASCLEHFSRKGFFRKLALVKLDDVMKQVEDAIDNTVRERPGKQNFLTAFFAKIEKFKISDHGAKAYEGTIVVPNPQDFAAIAHDQLQGSVKQEIIKAINAWNVNMIFTKKGLIDFLFDEVVGCNATCPFCKVPCDIHSGSKTQGKHSSTLHRPKGIGGTSWEHSHKLVSDDCCAAVASPTLRFRNEDTKNEYVLYNKYQEIYPEWTIMGNVNPHVEKYWKWVLATHNGNLAEYYTAQEAEVPEEWSRFTPEELTNEMRENYYGMIEATPATDEKDDKKKAKKLKK